MSKAFTKDEGSGAVELVRRSPPPVLRGAKRNMTPEGRAALVDEAARLQAERSALSRTPGVDVPQRAAEVEARLAFILGVLEATQVVTPDPSQTRAFFGAWVVVEDGESAARSVFRLVGPDEADPGQGRVSTDSPLGRALLGKEAGDEVTVQRPRGAATYAVVSVSYRPPA